MEGIRVSARKVVGREKLQFIVFGLITVLAGGVSSKLFAAPQGIGEQGREQSAQETRSSGPCAAGDYFGLGITGPAASRAGRESGNLNTKPGRFGIPSNQRLYSSLAVFGDPDI